MPIRNNSRFPNVVNLRDDGIMKKQMDATLIKLWQQQTRSAAVQDDPHHLWCVLFDIMYTSGRASTCVMARSAPPVHVRIPFAYAEAFKIGIPEYAVIDVSNLALIFARVFMQSNAMEMHPDSELARERAFVECASIMLEDNIIFPAVDASAVTRFALKILQREIERMREEKNIRADIGEIINNDLGFVFSNGSFL